MGDKNLQVSAISTGTVIDHMPAGSAIKLLELFDLISYEMQVSVGIYLNTS